ncbi:hypothetical protein BU17DRAFT_37451 [Hysterangium stoloniferum]|nr:hypothetical protein BU17DRAFT_37451 [Hysterangium stoloniferum]
MESVASSSGGVQRRTSQRSAGAADKRRLAIVETDSQSERRRRSSSRESKNESWIREDQSLFTRRGVDGSRLTGLSLMGPPDAQVSDYTGFSPIPASAPPTNPPPLQSQPSETRPSGHHRSMSDVQSMKKNGPRTSPRDVGIVGTMGSMLSISIEQSSPQRHRQRPSSSGVLEGNAASDVLTAPIFQTPKSRSPSPLPATPESSQPPPRSVLPELGRSAESDAESPITPSIGQEKEIGRPVAGPVVLDLNAPPQSRRSPRTAISGLPYPNQTPLAFLHYQPGIHSTAGPLPSPPRHIITQPSSAPPPPRPPRMLSPPPSSRRPITESGRCNSKFSQSDGLKPIPIASLMPPLLKSANGSDYSISAVSVSSSGTSPSRSGSHVREGAFPASSVFLSRPSPYPTPQSQPVILDKLVASVSERPDGESSSLSSALESASHEGPGEADINGKSPPKQASSYSWAALSAESLADGLQERPASPPSSYAASDEGRSTRELAANVVSEEDLSERRRGSLPLPPVELDNLQHLSLGHFDRYQTSSPTAQPILSKKTPSTWPDAMNFRDILLKKMPAERAHAYSLRFRELAAEETGLQDWLNLTSKKVVTPSRGFDMQPRHVSRNSIASEMTFPIRQDAYIATDLSLRSVADLSSPISPSTTLPYPTLAQGIGIRKRSSRTFAAESSLASPTSSPRSLGTGFFASLGRKTSIRKDKPPSSPNKLLSSRQPSKPPQARVVRLDTAPSLPGGPRAPARPTQRMNSVIMPSATQEAGRSEAHTLSIPNRRSEESAVLFDQHVQKLADLLPHADKEILAGYLRRAKNQDMMSAIGTYLADEQQGCVRSE